MAQINLPQNNNTQKTEDRIPPPPKAAQSNVDSDNKLKTKEESWLSFTEKAKLFVIIVAAITIPVMSTFLYSSYSHKKQLQTYIDHSEKQIAELQKQITTLNSPSVQILFKTELLLKEKIVDCNEQIQQLKKDSVYIEINKKIEKLDNEIIKCNVHLNKINEIKLNNYSEADQFIKFIENELKIQQ